MTDANDKFLEQLKIASPCPANWDEMAGDERRRFCNQCQLSVYNLSGMSRGEAESLVRESEGRVCVRMVRRADGTVLTRDCPVGLRVKRAARRAWTRAAAFAVTLFGTTLGCARRSAEIKPIPEVETPNPKSVVPALMGEVEIKGEACLPEHVLGRVAAPANQVAPPESTPDN